MKKIICFLFLLSLCSVNGICAESFNSDSENQFFSLNTSQTNFVQNLSVSDVLGKTADISTDHFYSKKRKKGRKGLLPNLISTVNESYLIIINFEVELTCSYKFLSHFYLHFAHGERGPPITV